MGLCLSKLYKHDQEYIENLSYQSIWEITVKDIDGNPLNMRETYGQYKVLICVNVACKCGFTSTNYRQLCNLFNKYNKHGLQILAFPANSFMQQEPWDPPKIKQYVIQKFNIKFPLMEKIEVNGPEAHDIYKFLRMNSELYNKDSSKSKVVPWNYSKFLVNREGQVHKFFFPDQMPMSMENDIRFLLELDNEVPKKK